MATISSIPSQFVGVANPSSIILKERFAAGRNKMMSKSKNVGGSQEQDNNWDEIVGFPAAALQQEEMLSVTVRPDLQPSMEHRVPGSCNEVYASTSRRFQLRFSTRIFSPVLTGKKIKGEGCEFVTVGLFDSLNGKEIVSGPEASAEVEIVVLEEVFGSISGDDWMPEEFDKKIVTVWKSKKYLLAGTKKLNLREGIAILDDINFIHDRHWVAKCRFRLGAKIVNNLYRLKVREAKTEPFELKDCRLECSRKHSSPSVLDDIWRLKKIARNGIPDKSLREANIKTVKDFLILLFLNPRKLHEIYGASGKNWKATVRHALTCTDKMVCYSSSSRQQSGVVVNASGEVLGLLSEGKFVHIDKLSDAEKANAHKSVISAFEHPENVYCFDNEKDVTHGSPHLPNAPNPSNFPSGYNFGTKETIDDHYYDHMQPSTCSWSIFSSCNVELNSLQASVTGQVADALMGDEELFDFCVSSSQNGQFHESYELNNTNESSWVRANKAQRRWGRLWRVWFKMWFFIKMGTASVHAKKKLRLC